MTASDDIQTFDAAINVIQMAAFGFGAPGVVVATSLGALEFVLGLTFDEGDKPSLIDEIRATVHAQLVSLELDKGHGVIDAYLDLMKSISHTS